jgi:hypothetical protein
MTVTCQHCGAQFDFDRNHRGPRRLYCSPRCRYAARDAKRFTPKGTPVTAACVDCGQAFTYVSSTAPRKRCDACPAYRPVDHAERPCAECKELFKPSRTGQRFCSDHCRYAAKNRRRGGAR